MADPDYGLDLSCDTDLDPMLTTVTGATLMRQAVARRLQTRNGLLFSDPLYGLDVRDLLSADIDASGLARIKALCAAELLRDERVSTVNVTATYATTTKTLTLTIVGDGALGPFSLVVNASGGTLTVSDLSA